MSPSYDGRSHTSTGGRFTVLRAWLGGRGLAVTLVLVLALGAQAAALVQPLLTRAIFDSLEYGGSLVTPILALLAVAVAGLFLNFLAEYRSGALNESLARSLRERTFDRILGARVSRVENFSRGDLLSRAGSDTRLVQQTTFPALVDAVVVPLSVVVGIAVMLYIDPLLALVVVVVLTVTSVAEARLFRQMEDLTEESQGHLGFATAVLGRAVTGLRTVKASGMEATEKGAYTRHSGAAFRAGVRFERRRAVADTMTYAAVDLTFILVLAVGVLRISTGDIGVGDLVAILLYIFIIQEPVESLVGSVSDLATGLGALRRTADLTGLPHEDADHRPQPTPHASTATATRSSVRLREVGASYGSTQVLRDVDVDIGPGLTAFVGASGSGKTTTLNLMLRFVEADAGSISVDGRDILELTAAEHRSRMSYVQQEAPVLGETVLDAVTYGAGPVTTEAVWAVLEDVELAEWVARHPEGVHTVLADGGTNLSGGQRQRIAIARAILQDRPIMLLDEATSQLDPRNEDRLAARVRRHAEQRIVVAVTHRPALALAADRVVVFDGGSVVVDGHHTTILEHPVYRDIVQRWQFPSTIG